MSRRLADPRFAGQEQDPAGTGERGVDDLDGGGELAFAADQAHLDRLELARVAGRREDSVDAVRGHGFGLALELELPRFAPGEHRRDPAMGLLADEHRPGFGHGLEPRGGVDRVTERRVLHAAPGAERPDDDRPGVDADADAEPLDDRTRARPRSRTASISSTTRSAARTARSGSSSWAVGAPNSASTPSPARSLTVPPNASTAPITRATASLTMSLSVLGTQAFGERGRAHEVGEHRRDDPPLLAHLPTHDGHSARMGRGASGCR